MDYLRRGKRTIFMGWKRGKRKLPAREPSASFPPGKSTIHILNNFMVMLEYVIFEWPINFRTALQDMAIPIGDFLGR